MSEGHSLKTIVLVTMIATVAATLVTASWEFSRGRIAANQRERLLESLYSVLDPAIDSENLRPVLVSALDPALLGSDTPIDVFVAMNGREPVAAVFASIAPDGYNAPIYLLIGIDAQNATITGVRVVSHRETPGLGDLIEIRKSNWILQFNGSRLTNPEPRDWAVDKDDGHFDSITGATVTPRAVVKAVHNTLIYFEANRDALFDRAERMLTDAESENAL